MTKSQKTQGNRSATSKAGQLVGAPVPGVTTTTALALHAVPQIAAHAVELGRLFEAELEAGGFAGSLTALLESEAAAFSALALQRSRDFTLVREADKTTQELLKEARVFRKRVTFALRSLVEQGKLGEVAPAALQVGDVTVGASRTVAWLNGSRDTVATYRTELQGVLQFDPLDRLDALRAGFTGAAAATAKARLELQAKGARLRALALAIRKLVHGMRTVAQNVFAAEPALAQRFRMAKARKAKVATPPTAATGASNDDEAPTAGKRVA